MDFLRMNSERVRAAPYEGWLDKVSVSDGIAAAMKEAVDFFNQGDAEGRWTI